MRHESQPGRTTSTPDGLPQASTTQEQQSSHLDMHASMGGLKYVDLLQRDDEEHESGNSGSGKGELGESPQEPTATGAAAAAPPPHGHAG